MRRVRSAAVVVVEGALAVDEETSASPAADPGELARNEARRTLSDQLQQMRDGWREGKDDYTSTLHVLLIVESATLPQIAKRLGADWAVIELELSALMSAGFVRSFDGPAGRQYELDLD